MPSLRYFCFFCLHDLCHEVAHRLCGLVLLLPCCVGVGAEGEARVVVSQRTRQRLDVHAVLEGQRGKGVTNAMVRLGGLTDTHSFFRISGVYQLHSHVGRKAAQGAAGDVPLSDLAQLLLFTLSIHGNTRAAQYGIAYKKSQYFFAFILIAEAFTSLSECGMVKASTYAR